MRIIAGKNKGATIAAPPGTRTRPTADRVREAVFSILGSVEGLAVLDLFAGSGALGLEALSRGAAVAELVDNRAGAAKTIAKNIAKLGLRNAGLNRRDYRSFLKDAAGKGRVFDLIFVDPPYKMHRVIEPELKKWLPQVAVSGGRVVVESDASRAVMLPLELITDKVYGETRIRVFRAT
ncbi:MAG: 16S rRNA (guanine(966)-N(2))-methyltransferase RsmD [Actinobacteria bacterium]|nr:16S rRNA (guanine(966)-N(2))-methyltransferase RsmD [Actinomycetota bacterium]